MDVVDSVAKSHFGPSFELREKQREILNLLYRSETTTDLIASLPTGYGKSILYQLLPSLMKKKLGRDGGCVLVCVPLTAIQDQQLRFLKTCQIPACKITQSGSVVGQDGQPIGIGEVLAGHYSIILCHPEALFCSEPGDEMLMSSSFQSVVVGTVVDECHTVEEWGKSFRKAFAELNSLPCLFPQASHLGLSGTLSVKQLQTLPDILGFISPTIVSLSPDRPNIYLDKIVKQGTKDSYAMYEATYRGEVDKLHSNPAEYPVTLMYIPLMYMCNAMSYCMSVFGRHTVSTLPYANIFSSQEAQTRDIILQDLMSSQPRIRLVFCTATVGMGFDSPAVERVIHCKPPRSLTQYLQEIGRAGRAGQNSEATLYYNKADLVHVDEDMAEYCKNDNKCLRQVMLNPYGFDKPAHLSACHCCIICSVDCMCQQCQTWV